MSQKTNFTFKPAKLLYQQIDIKITR